MSLNRSSTATRLRALSLVATLAGVLALLAGGPAAAQVGQVVEIAQVAQTQLTPVLERSEGYDWSVFIAAGFGLLGLYWIRRHISRL